MDTNGHRFRGANVIGEAAPTWHRSVWIVNQLAATQTALNICVYPCLSVVQLHGYGLSSDLRMACIDPIGGNSIAVSAHQFNATTLERHRIGPMAVSNAPLHSA